MEIINTIQQYVAQECADTIEKKAASQVANVIIAVVGVGLCIIGCDHSLSDMARMALLSIGFIAMAAGCIGFVARRRAVRYVYKPSNSPMRHHTCYIADDDRARCHAALQGDTTAALQEIRKVFSSNSMLQVIISNDSQIAIAQICTYDEGTLVANGSVCPLKGDVVRLLRDFLAKRITAI
ncbi:MAG: hypothetical protein IJV22_01370 [Bacteroidales bacterium]|nr:hypothetical protein [Bacteroidales bacterium]